MAPGDGARFRQRIALQGLERLDVFKRRQVEAAARKHHVAFKENAAARVFVGVVVPGGETALDIEAHLHVGQKDVVPQRVDARDDVAIVAAVGDVGPAAELLGAIRPNPQAGHRGPRVPRVVVRGIVHPRPEDDVPAVIGVRKVDLVQLRIKRRRPPVECTFQ